MSISTAERRQIENEMIFRRKNEKVGDGLVVLNVLNIEEGHPELVMGDDTRLHFKCECSDESCSERITMTLKRYQQIHKKRDYFIVRLNHEVDAIEKVIKSTTKYSIVKKFNTTPDPGNVLNATSVNNM
jgi:hypothetical protein